MYGLDPLTSLVSNTSTVLRKPEVLQRGFVQLGVFAPVLFGQQGGDLVHNLVGDRLAHRARHLLPVRVDGERWPDIDVEIGALCLMEMPAQKVSLLLLAFHSSL